MIAALVVKVDATAGDNTQADPGSMNTVHITRNGNRNSNGAQPQGSAVPGPSEHGESAQRRRDAGAAATPKRCGVGPGIVATSHETSTCARDGSATHAGARGRGPSKNSGT